MTSFENGISSHFRHLRKEKTVRFLFKILINHKNNQDAESIYNKVCL